MKPLFLCCYVILAAAAFAGPGREKKSPSPTLVLQSANSNENTLNNGEFVSFLKGNVVFSYDNLKIRSDEATWWRNKGIVDFRKNVKVNQGGSILKCDRMHFAKESNLLIASGHFHFIDSTGYTQLVGKEGEYNFDTKYFRLKGDPRLIRYDTAAAETLTITGLTMSYLDSLKKATVTDSVRITKGDLSSQCRLAHYLTEENSVFLRNSPEVKYRSHKIKGDSIDLVFGKENLKSVSIMGHSHGLYVDTSGSRSDTGYTHVWGDSLYMSVSDSGRLDSLWAYGKALSKYYMASAPEMVNEAGGKVMLMSFAGDGDVDRVKIWGNARSKYFVEEKGNSGANEASGDSIAVKFSRGKASVLTLAGRARGIYFPRGL